MNIRKYVYITLYFSIFVVHLDRVQAADGFVDIGVQTGIELGNGEPANDMIGIGFYAHYKFGNKVIIGFAIDSMSYDFEHPVNSVNIRQTLTDKKVDADTTVTNYLAWFEQRGDAWFWRAGGGIGQVDVDDLKGNVEAGGNFNITTDAGTEYLFLGGVGHRYYFNRKWSLNSYLGVVHHIADWKIKDTTSGKMGSVSDYTDYNFQIGVDYSF